MKQEMLQSANPQPAPTGFTGLDSRCRKKLQAHTLQRGNNRKASLGEAEVLYLSGQSQKPLRERNWLSSPGIRDSVAKSFSSETFWSSALEAQLSLSFVGKLVSTQRVRLVLICKRCFGNSGQACSSEL